MSDLFDRNAINDNSTARQKSSSPANEKSENDALNPMSSGFEDNRPQAALQKKLQLMADDRVEVKELKMMQRKANKSLPKGIIQRILNPEQEVRWTKAYKRYGRLFRFWPDVAARKSRLSGADGVEFKAILTNHESWNSFAEIKNNLAKAKSKKTPINDSEEPLSTAENFLGDLQDAYNRLAELADYDPIQEAREAALAERAQQESEQAMAMKAQAKMEKKKQATATIDANIAAKQNSPDALLEAGNFGTDGVSGFMLGLINNNLITIGSIVDMYRTEEDKEKGSYSIKIVIMGMNRWVIHAHIALGSHTVSTKGSNPVHLKRKTATSIEDGESIHVTMHNWIMPEKSVVQAAYNKRHSMKSWNGD